MALIPSQERANSRHYSIHNYNMFYENNMKKNDDVADLDRIEINTSRFEANPWSKSLDNFFDTNTNFVKNNRNLSSSLSYENMNKEGLFLQRFADNEDNVHVHHSKRLILPSISKRYENLDLTITPKPDFNTNYRCQVWFAYLI